MSFFVDRDKLLESTAIALVETIVEYLTTKKTDVYILFNQL